MPKDERKPHWGVVYDQDGPVGIHSPEEPCPADEPTNDGPAMVNNKAFRDGWDLAFGHTHKPSGLPN